MPNRKIAQMQRVFFEELGVSKYTFFQVSRVTILIVYELYFLTNSQITVIAQFICTVNTQYLKLAGDENT